MREIPPETYTMNKDELMEALDRELHGYEHSEHYAARNDDYFHRLEIMTYARNALYTVPMDDRMASMFGEDIPEVLQNLYNHWLAREMDWGTEANKANIAMELVLDYQQALEHRALIVSLHGKAHAEYSELEATGPAADDPDGLQYILRYAVYLRICDALGPNNHFDMEENKLLYSLEKPVATVFEAWRGTSSGDMQKDIDTAIRQTVGRLKEMALLAEPEAVRELQEGVDAPLGPVDGEDIEP